MAGYPAPSTPPHDSPWLDEDEDEDEGEDDSHRPRQLVSDTRVASQEWAKLSQRYSDAGYRDGITSGKEATLQPGFDAGFALASAPARRVGHLRGVAGSLLALATTTSAGGGKKHAPASVQAQLGDAATVAELRAVVGALGTLGERAVLPVDEEARAHAKEHGGEADREVQGPAAAAAVRQGAAATEAECRDRLRVVLARAGLDGVLLD